MCPDPRKDDIELWPELDILQAHTDHAKHNEVVPRVGAGLPLCQAVSVCCLDGAGVDVVGAEHCLHKILEARRPALQLGEVAEPTSLSPDVSPEHLSACHTCVNPERKA